MRILSDLIIKLCRSKVSRSDKRLLPIVFIVNGFVEYLRLPSSYFDNLVKPERFPYFVIRKFLY